MNTIELKEAINQLSDKKHVISEQAQKIKEDLESGTTVFGSGLSSSEQKKQLYLIQEFNTSVRILISVFKQSNFDELVVLISQPYRIFILNFFIGLLRGIGFALGVFVFVSLFIYFYKDIHLASLIQAALGF